MHRQLADDPPDRKGVSAVSIEAAAAVDVHRDRQDLSAHDTDRFDSDVMLVRKTRRQQQPGFNCYAHAIYDLEHPFLQYALVDNSRDRELLCKADVDAPLFASHPGVR